MLCARLGVRHGHRQCGYAYQTQTGGAVLRRPACGPFDRNSGSRTRCFPADRKMTAVMRTHLAPPGTKGEATSDIAFLDEAHIGNINGALGTITAGDSGAASRLVAQDEDPVGDRRPRPDRDGRRQRCRGLWHLLPGRSELRHTPVVDAATSRARSLRESGDGPAPWRSLGNRASAPHHGALRQVLGGIQRHRPLHIERPDNCHRVHRHLSCHRLPGPAESTDGRGGSRDRRRSREHWVVPSVRAPLSDARCVLTPVDPDSS